MMCFFFHFFLSLPDAPTSKRWELERVKILLLLSIELWRKQLAKLLEKEEEEEKDHRQRIKKERDFELDGRGGFHGYLYIEK